MNHYLIENILIIAAYVLAPMCLAYLFFAWRQWRGTRLVPFRYPYRSHEEVIYWVPRQIARELPASPNVVVACDHAEKITVERKV